MSGYVEKFLIFMRPAFSRGATFIWFVVCFAGFLTRTDNYGVSSIVRALLLAPGGYPSLLHFFHSTAWSAKGLFQKWREWLIKEEAAHLVEGRLVLFGDHTKNVKDGRRTPLVTTLHQDSETGSKPSFFRGHHRGALSLLIKAKNKFMSLPLEAEIHPEQNNESRATRLVNRAAKIAEEMEEKPTWSSTPSSRWDRSFKPRPATATASTSSPAPRKT